MKNTTYARLKNKIISGKLLPGSIITEREIGVEYGISRTPIREILRKLISEGLINNDHSMGYMVRNISLEEIFDMFQCREAIEGMAARLACQKGDNQFFSAIKELKERLEKINIERNTQEGIIIGRKLHDLIIITANNTFLKEFYHKLRNINSLTRNITQKSVFIEKKSKEAHLAIINSLGEKDGEKSEHYMREHLKVTCSTMVDYFYPNLFK